MLRFCYVPPPSDSPYYSPESFGPIQEKVKCCEEMGESVSIIGDINARLGGSVRDTPHGGGVPEAHRYTYKVITDPVC